VLELSPSATIFLVFRRGGWRIAIDGRQGLQRHHDCGKIDLGTRLRRRQPLAALGCS
jgi:hypothetical protein